MWALMWLIPGWGRRREHGADGPMGEPAPLTAPQSRALARRRAIVGMGVGLPYFGSLIAFSLETGRSPGYPATFAVVLLIMAVVATRNRRAASQESGRERRTQLTVRDGAGADAAISSPETMKLTIRTHPSRPIARSPFNQASVLSR
jgi:hypothetical protein